jgi:radical SAM superfamily enzyme YgiQ (UPF0313 family)
MALLGAVALQLGIKTVIVDASAENMDIEAALSAVLSYEPDVVGFSSTTLGIVATGELASRIKKTSADILTIIGGCHATALPSETLEIFSGFDLAVVGEGEETFVEILELFQKKSMHDNILGTAIRVDNGIKINAARPLIKNLDLLPLPAWELLPGFPHAFKPSLTRIKNYPCASVVLTRGCPFKCQFCDRSVFGRKTRSYSPDYAVKLLKDLRENFGVKEILIEDDTFVLSSKRLTAFCEGLIAENMGITWSCLGRADTVRPDLLKLMKKAGCWHISYGIESGDQKILDNMQKGETIAHFEQAVKLTKEAGLKSKGFFILGFPGETIETMEATINLTKRLPLDDISVSQMTPYPGSLLYEKVQEYGVFNKGEWRKMNQLTTVFVPYGLTKEEIEQARRKMLSQFYLQPRIIFAKICQSLAHPRLLVGYLKSFATLIKVISKKIKSDLPIKP